VDRLESHWRPLFFIISMACLLFSAQARCLADTASQFDLGFVNFERRKLSPCIENFTNVLREHPNNKMALYYRGRAYHYLDKPKRALKDLDKVIELDPNFSAAYKWRANTYLYMDEPAKSIADFDKAIKLGEDEPGSAYAKRAKALAALGRTNEAVKSFNDAIRFRSAWITELTKRHLHQGGPYDKEAQEYCVHRGQVLYNAKRYDEALASFDEGLKRGGFLDELYMLKAACHEQLRKPELAVLDYSQLLKVNPKDDGAYERRAKLYLKMGKFNEALADTSHAIEHYPGAAPSRLYRFRAELYRKLGKAAAADQDLLKAKSYDECPL